MNPWICPKCGRVWSGMVTQCTPCNHKISGTGSQYPFPKRPQTGYTSCQSAFALIPSPSTRTHG